MGIIIFIRKGIKLKFLLVIFTCTFMCGLKNLPTVKVGIRNTSAAAIFALELIWDAFMR